MLKSHIDAHEQQLLVTSRIPANSGHTLHKGTPREAFVKEFLEDHLPDNIAIGSGEIIDARSRPNEPRNQIDIVLYRRNYPKLSFGGGVYGFLAESVVATIEVKSVLDYAGMQQSIATAKCVKELQRSIQTAFTSGYQPPSILSYVVAYDGPATMHTVYGWLSKIHSDLGIGYPELPSTINERMKIPSPSIDGIFVLGRGFIRFENFPLVFYDDDIRGEQPGIHWGVADTADGNLLMLFLSLSIAVSGVTGAWLNPSPYLATLQFANHVLLQ